MGFATVMAADVAAIYTTDEFATPATHTALSGAATSLAVLLSDGLGNEMPGADDLGQAAEIRLQAADVTTVAVGETVTIGTTVWEVSHAVKSLDALEWICQVSRQ